MNVSRRRVRAIFRKELRDYRRNRQVIATMSILPLIFLVQPLVSVFTLPASASATLRREHVLLYVLAIPALVPAALASTAVVGERQQGTLEPVLTTPVRAKELLLGKTLAVLSPSVVVAYLVFACFIALIELFARADVVSGFIRPSDVLAQLIFTPLIAGWSIWIGVAVSTRVSDIRAAGQLSILASLPTVAVTTLIALNVIHATLRLGLALGVALLLANRLGWRLVAALFDRERLIAGS